MRRFPISGALLGLPLAAALWSGAPCARAEDGGAADPVAAQLDELRALNEELRSEVDSLRRDVREARDEALAARDAAEAGGDDWKPAAYREALGQLPESRSGALFSQPIGGANLRLLDLSLDTLFAAGWSSAPDDELEILQGGGHDPRQRGFTLQQVELSFMGAVDPYLNGEAHIVYFLDTEGESRFEIEEAFATTQRLPFQLEEHGLQLEAGTFFTEFGRINPTHPHAWDWQDQPVVLSRFFGEDGMRGPGARIGWLTPLPWFSEVNVGVQNAVGETMVSFLANEEVFEDRPIGGRPFGDPGVHSPEDLVYLLRWVNGFDLSDTTSAQIGGSGVVGPNGTGRGGRTWIAGSDLVVKWRPLSTDQGWPFVTWQSEFLYRHYDADEFSGCLEGGCDPVDEVSVPSRTLNDWGLYSQILWGFRRPFALGVRYEYATGMGEDTDCDADTNVCTFVSHNTDGYRDARHRVSPLLAVYLTHFSRLRLQYNYDHVRFLPSSSIHSVWAGLEFLFGAHPAHGY